MFVHKKKFGQNFLHNKDIVKKIVSYQNLKNRHVVEIGIGKGALTKELVKVSKHVTGFEIDNSLQEYINQEFASVSNFKPIYGDFLKSEEVFPSGTIIVSNPPYNISSPIIFTFLESDCYAEAILMFQEELANRILAVPNSKAYGKLSVIIDTFCQKEKIVKVSKKYFNPIPEIDSVVFYLKKLDQPLISKQDYTNYINFLSGCFLMKRKKIMNNLIKNLHFEKNILLSLNFNLDRRPEELSHIEYIELFKTLYEKKISC